MFEASADYGSKLAVVIWIDDFSEFLVKQNQKCAKLREIRRNQLSMEQGLFSGRHCIMGSQAEEKPGFKIYQ
ncbi:MAG: hypothetical protein LJE58_14145 [Thiogranum sp.]|nr:hypothetical protein [Thiogranum sp.]